MDERLRFVAQLLDGEAMSEVCRAFGISRKTGYKIFERYKEHGLEALTLSHHDPRRPNERTTLFSYCRYEIGQ
jgi:transposase